MKCLVFTQAPILPSIPVRFAGLKSSLDTTFGLIINQAVLASQRLWHFFFEPDPSAPSSYLRSARLPSATSALGCTPSTSASRRLENSLRTSFLRYFNSGDALRKKTSKPRIRTEMLDGLGGYRGSCATPRTRCQKRALDLQSLPIPYPARRTPATTLSLSLSGTYRWIL